MLAYIHEVWRRRLFCLSLARLDLRKRYRRSLLGVGWAFLQPVVMALVVCGVFSGAFQVSFATHFPYALAGLCVWGFLTGVVQQGCGCVYWSETYIRQHRAPMAIYPLRIVLPAAFHLTLVLSPLLLWAAATHGLSGLLAAAAVPPALLLLVTFGWAAATLCGFLNVYFPDTQNLCEIGLQILFYATPVVYRPRLLQDRGLGFLVELNPLAALLEVVRRPLVDGVLPAPAAVLLAVAFVALTFAAAAATLRLLERRIVFEL